MITEHALTALMKLPENNNNNNKIRVGAKKKKKNIYRVRLGRHRFQQFLSSQTETHRVWTFIIMQTVMCIKIVLKELNLNWFYCIKRDFKKDGEKNGVWLLMWYEIIMNAVMHISVGLQS